MNEGVAASLLNAQADIDAQKKRMTDQINRTESRQRSGSWLMTLIRCCRAFAVRFSVSLIAVVFDFMFDVGRHYWLHYFHFAV